MTFYSIINEADQSVVLKQIRRHLQSESELTDALLDYHTYY